MNYLANLISRYCLPSGKPYPLSSYGLKSLFEQLAGRYISNGEFKAAMRAAGVEACGSGDNPHYKIKIVDAPEVPDKYVSQRERERRARYGNL